MNETNYSELIENLLPAFGETLEMCGIALLLAVLVGIPIGVLSYITSQGNIRQNKLVKLTVSLFINVILSTPFVILLVLLLPFTKLVVGSSIGP